MYVRNLNKPEECVMHINVNSLISFETNKELTVEQVKEAVRKCRQKYPYLSMKILKNEQGDLSFYQQTSVELENIPVKWEVINNPDEFADWTPRFNRFGSINYDLSVNVFNLEIYSDSTNKYQLYLSINHASCDGRGVFVVSRDLLFYMNCMVNQIGIDPIESNKFLEVQRDFKHTYDVEQLKQEPVPVDKNQTLLSELKYPETKQDHLKSSFIGHFRQMNEQDSKRLLQICKEHKVTVQAVLSAANMICLLNEIDPQQLSGNNQIECLNTIPCDMRYYFGLNVEDLIKSAASLCWSQEAKGDQLFWSFARRANDEIHMRKNINEGLKWWMKLNNSIELPKVFLSASSIGFVSMNEHLLTGFKIDDVRFYMTTPRISYDENCQHTCSLAYVHAFTSQDRFNLVLSHSYPSLSWDWGEYFLNNVNRLMETILKNDVDLTINDIMSLLDNYSS